METLSFFAGVLFILTTFVTVYFFRRASASNKVLLWIVPWLILQTIISITGFYKVTDTVPPRFVLLIVPPLVLIIILFLTKRGRAFIDGMNIKWLTLLHIIRIPVEFTLFTLFLQKLIPEIMTFEGRNLDILSGISSLLVYYFGFVKKKMSNKLLIAWNIICLGLLINIVVIAILSAPFSFQRFAFDQPNVALLSFPFVWLPACVVPLVLFSHLVSLRQLLIKPAMLPQQNALVMEV